MGYGKPWKLETYKNILYCTGNVIRCIVANIMDYTQPYKDWEKESLPIWGEDDEFDAKELDCKF